MQRLLELYELPTHLKLSGASAGALAIVLSHCGVEASSAHAVAFRLAEAANCLERPLGLCGRWGRLVHDWLDALLPMDAAERCRDRCHVAVTRCSPLPAARALSDFGSRTELIDALMKSTHIPFFMDGRPTRGGCADGELLGWLRVCSSLSILCPSKVDRTNALVIAHTLDQPFLALCERNGWSAFSVRGTDEFMAHGAAWVDREEALGVDGHLRLLVPYRRRAAPPVPATARTAGCGRGSRRRSRSPPTRMPSKRRQALSSR